MRPDESWSALERWLGAPIATPLREAIARHGGDEIGAVRLYAIDELIERNQCYETQVYCPGYLTVGDDGGGRAILVHAALTPSTVFVVGHGSMSEDDLVAVGDDLASWLHAGCPLD
jgi:hypothetical protein